MTVILCDGEFPTHYLALALLDKATQVVCCDGAALKLLQYGRSPAAIVGDLDSLPDDLKTKFADSLHYSACQETNDLSKAFNYCYNQGIRRLSILGATGLREDHTLGNISLLVEYASKMDVEMVTNTGVFYPLLKSTTFACMKGQQVSIFSLIPECKLTATGLKYPIINRALLSWNEGTLNETLAEEFRLEFEKGKFLVYVRHAT